MTKPSPDAVTAIKPLGFPWQTRDPFLFCVYHDDAYPKGNDEQGPAASLAGRQMGQDFAGIDGWRMYHGDVVPGFPQHPHRGFETVTIVRKGLVDHSDSLGATARYGSGDVQWLTAGGGIQHAEMFPLTKKDVDNPLELFQIWLNLPQRDKMVDPHFTMLWAEQIPEVVVEPESGGRAEVSIVAGEYGGKRPPSPPPNSWASNVEADVAIMTIKLAPHTKWVLPAAKAGTDRTFYTVAGQGLAISGKNIPFGNLAEVKGDVAVEVSSSDEALEVLMLQGRPIGEPVAKYGPFVMNTQQEIQQAMADYRRTQFGGWPWSRNDPVHEPKETRFAKHADGKVERPT